MTKIIPAILIFTIFMGLGYFVHFEMDLQDRLVTSYERSINHIVNH